jgi:hypothetical protein
MIFYYAVYAAFAVLCPYTDILGENVKLVVLTKM